MARKKSAVSRKKSIKYKAVKKRVKATSKRKGYTTTVYVLKDKYKK